jgi:hypothetical protein
MAAVTEPYRYVIELNGNINIIDVEQGRIRISEANCPNEACVRQGWKNGGIIPIVCLPHRLVITFEGGDETNIDAIIG